MAANTTFKDILDGLEAQLLTMANLPTNIVWENDTFTPTIGTTFMRVSTLPVEPVQTSLGTAGLNTQTGTFALDLFFQKGVGRAIQNTLVSEIVGHFSRGTTITQNSVVIRMEKVSPLPAIEEDNWFHVPVHVKYIAYTNN